MNVEKDDAYYREAELDLKRRELAFKERENTFGARFLKSVAIVLPLALSLLAPYLSYRKELGERELAAVTAERKAAFDVQKVSIYADVVYVTGKLRQFGATPAGRASPRYAELHAEFENLYWSRLPLVEDDNVARAMVVFRTGLGYVAKPTPENLKDLALNTPMTPQNMGGIQPFLDQLAIIVSQAIRDDLAKQPASFKLSP